MKPYNSDISVEEFIARHATSYDEAADNYFREPFAKDTKVGKNSAIYNAHSYHTKVPPEGIVPYILHYTEPGELILDPFCGSGMTGVAAMMCARPPMGVEVPPGARLGARNAILNDLSPAACHIAYNYTHPVDVKALKAEFDRIMRVLQPEFDWLYGTSCDRCDGPATIQYTIWSDVYKCCRCGAHMVLWEVAVDHESGAVRDTFACPSCGFTGKKTKHTRVDSVPVVTNYECQNGCRPARSNHRTTKAELRLIEEINTREIPYWYPTDSVGPNREMYIRSALHLRNITRVCDFYTKRNLWALAAVWEKISNHSDDRVSTALRFVVSASLYVASKMSSFRYDSRNPDNTAGGIHKGTLYIPSLSKEAAIPGLFRNKWPYLSQVLGDKAYFILDDVTTILTGSASATLKTFPGGAIDYIWTDPPFGSNIFYADCSLLWEAWLQDFTDVKQEAVWNKSLKPEEGGKTLDDYRRIMASAFAEMHRILKPGRWASVVFSNSDDRVWHAIRETASEAGFDLSNTMALDKKQRSFKQVRGEKGEENVVGTDIIMNLHKRSRVQVAVRAVADLDETVLGILRHHLGTLPERIQLDSRRYADSLRTIDALYSVVLQELMERKLSNRGVTMPYIDEVCRGAFKKVEGKWYLPSEEIRDERLNLEVLDEPSAIAWIRGQLSARAMTLPELIPSWRQATLKVGNRLEKTLPQLLEENFWRDADTNRWRPPSETERQHMGDERTLRIRRNIQRLREGKLDATPKDAELLEWMSFAYQHLTDHRAVVEIYQRLNPAVLSEAERKKAKRLYEFCVTQVAEAPDEGQNSQLRLFR